LHTSLEGPQQPTLLDSQGVPVAGASRLSVFPAEVQVSVPVRQLASFKTLPLLVRIRGRPRAGFGVSGVTVSPTEITATGSPKVLSQLSKLYTAPVSIAGKGQGTVKVRSSVQLPKGVGSSVRTATVSIQLAPVYSSTSIQIGIAPVGVLPGLVAHTTPASVLVTVVGPSSQLARAGKSMRAVVNVTGYAAGTYTLTPSIAVPRGLSIGGVYPQTVTVTLGAPSTQ
jgi:YbbR domain-containing protein